MVEYFEHVVVAGEVNSADLAKAWKENLELLEERHPRVFKKVVENLRGYTGLDDLDGQLRELAKEFIDRRQRQKRLQSVKIALTYSKYLYYHHGSIVKLYRDGTVAYAPRATIEGYGFVIHEGEQVA